MLVYKFTLLERDNDDMTELKNQFEFESKAPNDSFELVYSYTIPVYEYVYTDMPVYRYTENGNTSLQIYWYTNKIICLCLPSFWDPIHFFLIGSPSHTNVSSQQFVQDGSSALSQSHAAMKFARSAIPTKTFRCLVEAVVTFALP